MKPYLGKHSYRPGCGCCNINKGPHHFRPSKLSQEDRTAKRSGKKTVRQQARRTIKEES